jgi:dihydrodipicolinate synthase/N-acetylneuraminate lyase
MPPHLDLRQHLADGQVIPAMPLALSRSRRWDEERQRSLVRYYLDAGTGGIAVAVHATQFAIRDKAVGLFEPVLRLVAETAVHWGKNTARSPFVLIAGICGRTAQAMREARIARRHGYHAGLLSLAAWSRDPEPVILASCRTVAREIPLFGFYLQDAAGGRAFSYDFWRRFAEIPELAAIKMAPFDRYRTIDVVRAVMEAGRTDVALYTGNDDHIIGDLLTPFEFGSARRHVAGGLLGQWGVWTERAVALLNEIKLARSQGRLETAWWTKNAQLTDANAAIFDAAHRFAGCIPGVHEVLRRQGLFASTACLDPKVRLSAGQSAEISRVIRAYPWLVDDGFVHRNLHRWQD